MKQPTHRLKTLATDLVGVLLIIGAGLTGWLPGPGGIPLFFAGLGLLSINHEWARRLLQYLKHHGAKWVDKVFVDHPVIKALYDALGLALIVGASWLLFAQTRNLIRSLGIALLFLGAALFLTNRKRLQRLSAWARRK